MIILGACCSLVRTALRRLYESTGKGALSKTLRAPSLAGYCLTAATLSCVRYDT
nr:MAG TPA: hypothetical protein [Caudoviricetes sp.]